MPKKSKPIVKVKNPGRRKRGAKRIAKKYVSRIIDACAQMLAQNRDQYFDSLLSVWEQATDRLDRTAQAILANEGCPFAEADREICIRPFDRLYVMLFTRIAGQMVEAEKRVFRLRVQRLTEAWSKFAAAIPVRRPDLKPIADTMCNAALALTSGIAAIFLREDHPQYSPVHGERCLALKRTLAHLVSKGEAAT